MTVGRQFATGGVAARMLPELAVVTAEGANTVAEAKPSPPLTEWR